MPKENKIVVLNIDGQFISSNSKPKHMNNSFYASMRCVLFIAQCFSMMPVQGITYKDSSKLRFKWVSFRMFYSILIIIGSLSMVVISILRIKYIDMDIKNSSGIVFHTSTTLILVLFIYFAYRWPALVHRWESMEQELKRYDYPTNLESKLNLISACILIAAFVEHVLSILQIVFQVLDCHSIKRGNLFYNFSIANSINFFSYVPYHYSLSLYIIIIRFIATFSWNFLDLFIMLLTYSLSERYKQINMELYKIEQRNISETLWKQLRLEYNALTQLTKTLDNEIAILILFSFGNNLYFICIQLFHTIMPLSTFYSIIYFYWSFLYLLLRTSLVSLFGARIHDQSILPARILFSVPSESYCKEVKRFIQHVTSDHVSITGMRFFSITRNFLITIAGTIVTYEIIIVQLNSHNNSTKISNNTTDACF